MRSKKPKLPVRQEPRPASTDLRKEATRQTVARLLLLGWSLERIARRLHCHHRTITRAISTAEFQTLYTTLQREHLARIDHHCSALLDGAINGLEKMLRHSDWRCRDSAIEKILRIHGKFIERIDVSGSLDHRAQGQRGDWELVEGMTDEMRQKALELLRLQRGVLQRQLPARLTDPDRDGTNGRFISNDDEEKTR
jgi:hypothetical protein